MSVQNADPPETNAVPYDAEFFNEQRAASLRSARVIVPIVCALVRPRSVVDVGCGVGAWLKAFAEDGVEDYLGLDGDYVPSDQLLIDPSRFRAADLRDPPELGRSFDLSVCLEVGEHLPAKAAPKLVQTLTRAAPCVLFSAAAPGQGGTHHVNERWPDYWRRLFAAQGYDRLDPVRPQVWRNPDVEWWYKQNVYLYCRRDVIDADPELRAEGKLAASCPFELVHTDVFGPLTTLTGLLRALPRAARAGVSRLFSRDR